MQNNMDETESFNSIYSLPSCHRDLNIRNFGRVSFVFSLLAGIYAWQFSYVARQYFLTQYLSPQQSGCLALVWHSPDRNAAMKHPGSNSGGMWTAQIRIGGKYVGTDGKLYRNNRQNKTHIPLSF